MVGMRRPKKQKVPVGEAASSSQSVEPEAVAEQPSKEYEPAAPFPVPMLSPASLTHTKATAAARAYVREMAGEVAVGRQMVRQKEKEHQVVLKLHKAKLERLEKRERSKNKLAPYKLLKKLFGNEEKMR